MARSASTTDTQRCDYQSIPFSGEAGHSPPLPPRRPKSIDPCEVTIPLVMRSTSPSRKPADVGLLVPRHPEFPTRDSRFEKQFRSRATKFADDLWSCLPEVSNIPLQPTLILKLATAHGIADRIMRLMVTSTLPLEVSVQNQAQHPKAMTGGAWRKQRSHHAPRDTHEVRWALRAWNADYA